MLPDPVSQLDIVPDGEVGKLVDLVVKRAVLDLELEVVRPGGLVLRLVDRVIAIAPALARKVVGDVVVQVREIGVVLRVAGQGEGLVEVCWAGKVLLGWVLGNDQIRILGLLPLIALPVLLLLLLLLLKIIWQGLWDYDTS